MIFHVEHYLCIPDEISFNFNTIPPMHKIYIFLPIFIMFRTSILEHKYTYTFF